MPIPIPDEQPVISTTRWPSVAMVSAGLRKSRRSHEISSAGDRERAQSRGRARGILSAHSPKVSGFIKHKHLL